MEPWVGEWIKEQRSLGVKCLEIKQRGTKYYVYHSTTHWDKNIKKAIKTSKYLGRLDRERGMIESHENEEKQKSEVQLTDVRNVTEYGNSILLQESLKDLKPLLIRAFPENWE